MANVPENIKKFRKERKLSQSKLAEMIRNKFSIEMAQNTISQYENGAREPNLDTLEMIAKTLEVSLSDIMGMEIITKETDLRQLEEIAKKFGGDYSDKLGLKFDQSLLDLMKNVKDAGLELLKDSPIHPFEEYLRKQFARKYGDLLESLTAEEKQKVYEKTNEYVEMLLISEKSKRERV